MRYLRDSRQIRDGINALFNSDDEKWAIVAFVGANGLNYLPDDINNLKVICWPRAGGTNPYGISQLIDAGIDVYFCENLHTKVYYCKNKGIIICSANLTDNALGESGLSEFGVYIDDTDFDINKNILDNLDYYLVDSESLTRLRNEHNKFYRRTNYIPEYPRENIIDFTSWYCQPIHTEWKIISYSIEREIEEDLREEVYEKYGTRTIINYNEIENADDFSVGDFVFQFKTDDDENIRGPSGNWFIVDHISHDYNVIVQIADLNTHQTPPPFIINPRFRGAFMRVFNNMEWDQIIDERYRPREEFLLSIQKILERLSKSVG